MTKNWHIEIMKKNAVYIFALAAGWLLFGTLTGQSVNPDLSGFPDQSGTPDRTYRPDGSVMALHRRILTLDSHVDTPTEMRNRNLGIRNPSGTKEGGHLDIPRMDEGGLDAVFFAVYVKQGARTPEGLVNAHFTADSIITWIRKVVARFPDKLELAVNPEDAERIAKAGKHAIYMGMENGYPIGKDLSAVAHFYKQGIRYITLCHMRNNDLCDSATDSTGPEFHGLSAFGKDVVREMNRLGMMVDLSHVSDETFYDAVKLSRAPVILSHSCCRALSNVPRNATDDMLRALVQNGGVIQINLFTFYLRKDVPSDSVTVHDVVDHIEHVIKVAGIDHVGIGTDFDGGVTPPRDVRDVSEIPNITAELMRRGYSETDIAKIWSGNFLRVFSEVQRIAKELNQH
jgi:membrane dipeptidase